MTNHKQEIAARFDHLVDLIEADQIGHGAWVDGSGRACLLLALAPEMGEGDDYTMGGCPAWLLPRWFAVLTPWIDDRCSDSARPAILRRYADVVRRAGLTLDADAWRRCDYAARRAAVVEARSHTSDPVVVAACGRMIDLCDREIAGDCPTADEWATAVAAAQAAARAAARAACAAAQAARAVVAAAEAAQAAAQAAAWAACAAAQAARAVAAAVVAAVDAGAAWAAARAAASGAARAEASERIIAAVFDALETEIARST